MYQTFNNNFNLQNRYNYITKPRVQAYKKKLEEDLLAEGAHQVNKS